MQNKRRRLVKAHGLTTTDAAKMTNPAGYIFGYGSLINPQSIVKTLKEPTSENANEPCILKDFERSWTLEEQVFIQGNKHKKVTMVFLNIMARQGPHCNGVIFPVSQENITSFDKRERRYNRLDVSHLISLEKKLPVYTYVGKDEYSAPPTSALVSELYEDIVDTGLECWGDAYREEYEATTLPHTFQRTRDRYTFDPVS